MARRVIARTRRGNQQRRKTICDGALRDCARTLEVGERNVGGGEQPAVDAAEVEHGAVVRIGRAVDQVEIVARAFEARAVAVDERVEDELAREAEQIERARSVFLVVRARGRPVLALQISSVVVGAIGRIAMARERRSSSLTLVATDALPSKPSR